MASPKQLVVLEQGLEAWNQWRLENPDENIDLSGEDLRSMDIGLMNAVRRADTRGLVPENASWIFILNEIVGYDVLPLNLRGADLRGATLDEMDLQKADCRGADFSGASLRDAKLGHANLSASRFVDSDMTGAKLRLADLSESVLVRTKVGGADLGHATVYGTSVWDLIGDAADETSLIVTPPGQSRLSADSLAIAQFLYTLLRNPSIRNIVDTITTRVVLVLGNFKEPRKRALEAIRGVLRSMGFIPVIFDFDGPTSKDTTGTVETLARLSRFVVADLTDPSSVPHELATIVPFLRTTPVLLLRLAGATGYSMVKDLKAYPWVLGVQEYSSDELLIENASELIAPARALADRLQGRANG